MMPPTLISGRNEATSEHTVDGTETVTEDESGDLTITTTPDSIADGTPNQQQAVTARVPDRSSQDLQQSDSEALKMAVLVVLALALVAAVGGN